MTMHLHHAGRRIAYSVQGPADGYPVLYCHGAPGSSLEASLDCGGANAPPLRLIGMDRPGYGESEPAAEYDLAAHAADLAAVARRAGVARFSLFGFSAGGVFALTAAAHLGAAVERVVLVATPAPPLLSNPLAEAGELLAQVWHMAREQPGELPARLQPLVSDGATLAATMRASLSSADRELLATAPTAEGFQRNMARAAAAGPEITAGTIARDTCLVVSDWSSYVPRVTQAVHIFHGDDDALVTRRHAQALHGALPIASLDIRAGAGHYAGIHGAPAMALWRVAAGIAS